MSYLALARKWRPRTFADVLGQGHVVKALEHALNGDRLHPAILLTGTRGVGKTTLARIIAKGLNCEKNGVTASPCGKCSACMEIDEGRFVDLLEIDAASRTKVDDTRAMLDNVQYAPVRGRYKVYLIDEVHMLSGHSFNALLKTLEEPPPHVKFILATTDPQKLPVTVLSRCLQFNLKRLPQATIRDLLTKVLEEEKVSAEPGAIAELARAADGSMRDALSLTDQAIAFAGGAALTRTQTEEMLGVVGRRTLFEVLEAVAKGDPAAVLACMQRLDAQAPDYDALLNDLAAILQRIAVLQVLPDAGNEDDDPVLRTLADSIDAADVQLYYQIVVFGRRDLPWAPDPRLGFEMTLLRLLAFRVGGAGSGERVETPRAATKTAAPKPAPKAAAPIASAAPAPTQHAIAEPAPVGDWDQRLEQLGLEGLVKQLARNCACVEAKTDAIRLALDPRMKHLLSEPRRVSIEQALTKQSGQPVKLAIDVGAQPVDDTPAQRELQRTAARNADAEAAIEKDPVIQMFKERFGATVRPGSVEPLTKSAHKQS
ncbi:MAG TPA: DNA polymerase III subunit gamma/tau [Nevskiaceae bacterium]|nr:DNA polymerase III subunit gamma/tau [Nevskiaceae bacterium]